MHHQHKTQYNQPELSPSRSLQYSLSASPPKQSHTHQQTYIPPSIVYTTYSVDYSKIPRSTHFSKTLSQFYSRTPRSPA